MAPMATAQMTTPVLDALEKPFVIRNTFLEIPEDASAGHETRNRSVSDYTDARRRSWSNGSDLKNLEAVMEAEYDTDVPDEEEQSEFERTQSSSDGRLSLTSSSFASLVDLSDEAESLAASRSNRRTNTGSSTLSAELLQMLEEEEHEVDDSSDAEGDLGDDGRRERSRTSSTLFWIAHEATGQLTLVDPHCRPMEYQEQIEEPSTEPDEPGEDCHLIQSDTQQGGAAPAVPQVPPQDLYHLQSFVPAYMPMWPGAMPWLAWQPAMPLDNSALPAAVEPASASAPSMRKPASSSSLDLPKSGSELSLEALVVEASEDLPKQQGKKKQRVRQSVWQPPSKQAQSEPTTVMLRNLPNRYTRKMFLRMLDVHGFNQEYDFVYLPIDFKHRVNLGYAFVNMASHESAVRLKETLNGFRSWAFDSLKVCEAVWASPHQGLALNVERYRNSPVMHASVSDEFKPVLFKDGVRVAFPAPTKSIRAPATRDSSNAENA